MGHEISIPNTFLVSCGFWSKEKISNEVLSPEFAIEVDGGINDKTIVQARDAGANRFVETSYLWNSSNPKEAYDKLRSLTFS